MNSNILKDKRNLTTEHIINYDVKKGTIEATVLSSEFDFVGLMNNICVVLSEICHYQLKNYKIMLSKNQITSSETESSLTICVRKNSDNSSTLFAEVNNGFWNLYSLIDDLQCAIYELQERYSQINNANVQKGGI